MRHHGGRFVRGPARLTSLGLATMSRWPSPAGRTSASTPRTPTGWRGFWGNLLGLTVELGGDGDAVLRGELSEQTIWVNTVPEPRTVKQRVHLDLEADVARPDPRPRRHHGAAGDRVGVPLGACSPTQRVASCASSCATRSLRRRGPSLRDGASDTVDARQRRTPRPRGGPTCSGATVVDDERGVLVARGRPRTAVRLDRPDRPVPDAKRVKNRIHWDITSDDLGGDRRPGRDDPRGADRRRPLARPGRPRGQRVLRLRPELTGSVDVHARSAGVDVHRSRGVRPPG